MSDIRQELINLYSKSPAEEVHQSSKYKNLFKKYAADPLKKRRFHEERERIEGLRRKIDLQLGDGKPEREQVEMALRLLWRQRRKPELAESLIEIMRDAYVAAWENQKRRAYFEKWSNIFLKAKPYFLSFTTRNRGRPAQNQINRNYKYFIIDGLGKDVYEHADLAKENLLAQTIDYHLRNHRPGGFYFPRHEGNNEIVEEKLLTALERSLALVQLIQSEMFRNYDERRNWCHFEHKHVEDKDPQRVLYVQIDPTIDENEVELEFDDWYRLFSTKKDALKMKWTRWGDEVMNIDKNFDKVSQQLVEQIDRVRDHTYLNIP